MRLPYPTLRVSCSYFENVDRKHAGADKLQKAEIHRNEAVKCVLNYDVKIIENITEKRPQVLLIGNGILQAVTGTKWDELLCYVSKSDLSDVKKLLISRCNKIPYSIKANALSSFDDAERRGKYSTYLLEEYIDYYKYENKYIKRLLDVNCNTILTTNYTYELENHIYNNFYATTDETKRKYVCTTNKKSEDSSKLPSGLSAFYRLQYKNGINKDIWHIHGEVRKKSSLVLTHDEYGRLTRDILNFNRMVGNKYVNYKENLKVKSWVDYFMIADIYIVGFGLDYSEFDIWWLLNRRKREKAGCGKIFFFEPCVDCGIGSRYQVMHEFGIAPCNCGFIKPTNLTNSEEKVFYNEFYEKAIEQINRLVDEKRGGIT